MSRADAHPLNAKRKTFNSFSFTPQSDKQADNLWRSLNEFHGGRETA